ncbi:MAG: methyltransferase [Roseibacillus sp.]
MKEDLLADWNPESFLHDLVAGHYTVESSPKGSSLDTVTLKPRSVVHEQLLRLFLAGEDCATDLVKEALPTSAQELIALGILEEEEGMIRSQFRIRPHPEGYLAEDFPARLYTSATDFVMGVAPTTRMTSRIAPDCSPETVLDLCCGGGWLALTQALAGRSVTACDLNPRALQVAALNSRLLQAPAVSWRQGPWLEPVAGETFDLIVANPPFVQTPGSSSVALDTPAEEDTAAILLPQLAHHLNPGGYACLLMDWQFTSPEDWQSAIECLIPREGIQSLLFEVQRQSPEDYARHWLRQDTRFQEEDALGPELQRWLDHFASRGTVGISSGFIVLRKCEVGQEFSFHESRSVAHFPPETSAELSRFFTNQDWLREQTGDLLDEIFEGVEGVRKLAGSVRESTGWVTESLQLSSPARLLYDGNVDPALLLILETASVGKPVRSALPELARIVGADEEALAPQVTDLLKELITRTLLVPCG